VSRDSGYPSAHYAPSVRQSLASGPLRLQRASASIGLQNAPLLKNGGRRNQAIPILRTAYGPDGARVVQSDHAMALDFGSSTF
jgi:hypothetical protein